MNDFSGGGDWFSQQPPPPSAAQPAASAPAAPGGAASGPPTINAAAGDIPGQIRAYFKARGVSDQETDYWVQKWGEFGANDPNYFNSRLADADVFRGGQANPATSGAGAMSGVSNGSFLTPFTEQFKARDPNQIAQDPAYQFQLAQGLRGIQSGAAAKGTLLTGGTLKALDSYGQGLASTYDDKFYSRDMGEYNLRKTNFQDNQDRPFNKLVGASNLGKPAA